VPQRPIDLRRVTLAAHLVFAGYGHWLPNDLRGSGSEEIRKDDLEDLGEIHYGRKVEQPSREDLREFHQKAEPLLEHEVLWFDEPMRLLIAQAFAKIFAERGWTCWACAVLRDHAHLLLRNHKDKSDLMWRLLAEQSANSLRGIATIKKDHPIWSARPYQVLLISKPEVIARIPYINGNPSKHRLPHQHWDFVTRCPWLR
jgi:REP-associated tyrosine transposase